MKWDRHGQRKGLLGALLLGRSNLGRIDLGREAERAERLAQVSRLGRKVEDHESLALARERGLQQVREFPFVAAKVEVSQLGSTAQPLLQNARRTSSGKGRGCPGHPGRGRR